MNIEITVPEVIIENWRYLTGFFYFILSFNLMNLWTKFNVKQYTKKQNKINRDHAQYWEYNNMIDFWKGPSNMPHPMVLLAPFMLPAYILYKALYFSAINGCNIILYPSNLYK